MTTPTDLPGADHTVLHVVPGGYVPQPAGTRTPSDVVVAIDSPALEA